MALLFADLVRESSVTTGTGTLTLSGAPTGFQTFSNGVGNGNSCYYLITGLDSAWEAGLGTVGAGTLARSVLKSSNANALVNFNSSLTVQQIPIADYLNSISPIVCAVCTSNLVKTSSTAYSDITGMSVTLAAGTTYIFEIEIYITEAATTAGYKVGSDQGTATFTSSKAMTLTMVNNVIIGPTSSSINLATLNSLAGGSTVASANNMFRTYGSCVVNAGGTFKLQGAQNTSDGNSTTFPVGCYMKFTKV